MLLFLFAAVILLIAFIALFNPWGLRDTIMWIGQMVRGELAEDEPSYTEEEISLLNRELDRKQASLD